jgi:amino acid adenylation domain-containing protein
MTAAPAVTYVLTDLLRDRAAAHAEETAFVVGSGSDIAGSLTFGEWFRRCESTAASLVTSGVGCGDRVGLFFDRLEFVDYVVAYTAVLRAGGVAVHLPTADAAVAARLVEHARCIGTIRGSSPEPPVRTGDHAVWDVRVADLSERSGDPLPRVDLAPHDPADVLWTSGTTGPPKAFVNAHGTLMYGRGLSGLSRLDISRAIVAPMPMGTASSAMSAAFMPLVAHEPVLLCDPDDLEAIGSLAERFDASTFMVTPWTAMRIVRSGLAGSYDLSRVTTVALASAGLPARIARDLQRLIPDVSIRTFFAQGEAVPAVVLGTFDPDQPMRLGIPGPESEVKVAGPDGEEVPAGMLGEIAMRHPAPQRRYLDDALEAATYRDGWRYTADLGHRDVDGSVHLFDREVDVIRTAAGPVSSQAVEQVVYDHPDVVEVAVVAAGPPGDSRPEAYVVLSSEQPDLAAVRDLATSRLAAHEVPVAWHIVAALPRGRTGKVTKHQLRSRTAPLPPADHAPAAPSSARSIDVQVCDDDAVALVWAALCVVVARNEHADDVIVELPDGGGLRAIHVDGSLHEIAHRLRARARTVEADPAHPAALAFLTVPADQTPAEGPTIARVESDRAHRAWVEVWSGHGAASADLLLRQAEQVLLAAATDPSRCARTLPLLSDAEARLLLLDRNDTDLELPHAATLHEEFAVTAARAPEAVAVIEGTRRHTFADIAAAIGRRARALASMGAGPGTRVGLYLDRSAELLVTSLAATTTGAAFVPLDPTFPAERRAAMLAAAGCSVVVTSAAHRAAVERVAPPGLRWMIVDEPEADPGPEVLPAQVSAADTCYVMFTSGSTGAPKGIALRHGGVLNNLTDLRQRFGIGPGDAVLTLSSPAFDMSVVELIGVPLAGGTAVIPDPPALSSPRHWVELVQRAEITIWNSVPALAELFVDELERTCGRTESLRLVMLGGDWVPLTLPDRLRALSPVMQVVALGGATEASVHSTVYPVSEVDEAWSSIPYGLPMANQRVYVLDAGRQPVPVGVPGELHLAGAGLADGYVGGTDDDRFHLWSHPLVGHERLYRTGDRVVWRPDGLLEILGRIDLQLKIHGVRVEARAIERALLANPQVHDCAVVVTGREERERRLTAFLVAAPGAQPEPAELRTFLTAVLPPREIPGAFVVVDALPLNANGKVDRQALAALRPGPDTRSTSGRVGSEPTTDLETHIATVWRSVLGLEALEHDSNFFLVGGDSFTAMSILDEIHPQLSLEDLFAHPTVSELAARLRQVVEV